MGYQLSILDRSPISPGSTAFDSLQKTVQLAQKAEEWGYSRFWVSEHHHSEQVAGSSPEVLISYLLARTNSIRIGSGGVMLQHYSPYKVAENFPVLSTLAPGRIDLGIGKAPGGLPLSTKALQYGTVNDGTDFPEKLSFLQKLIENSLDEHHPLAGIQATPIPPAKPEMFLLGASSKSAELAARLQIPFVFAKFINSDETVLAEAARIYRNVFPNGQLIISVAAIAAPNQQEAEQIAGERKIVKVHLQSGRSVTVQSIEQAEAFGNQTGEPYEITEQSADVIAGTPGYVRKVLDQLHETYHANEFILHTPVDKEIERFRSFQLLSPLYADGLNNNMTKTKDDAVKINS
ncbi:LLM class flavin-dependent oxidoreductase [Bacillus sp. BRMEA1]|uniref:LLM class flavin-dependent oxidoreductase n=1 Tax=Neobacillus endophyticus TaxID=2738405 RepID=UPI0015635B19|nr:LLM class flavin-dependent oxidoreductase [Neobacillus endophyticus]NRD79104.1 LLM class flavin-dependent oxidoreductase [Neobacillus endophyticus]